MSSIPVKRYITHNCVENCIANLCDFFKIDFRPLFLFSWDFGFKSDDLTLENKIHFNSKFDSSVEKYYEISKLYFNMSFIHVNNNLTDIMRKLIAGKILLIKSDSYYLPWNLAFQKHHIPHSFLATYDFIKKSIIVIDSFCSNDFIELGNLNELNIEMCLFVQLSEDSPNKNTSILLKNRYIAIIEINKKNDVYRAIENFSNELETIDSIEQLTENLNDLSNALLIRRLSNIANARYNTKCFFEYLQWPIELIETMDGIYTKWESVKNMFLKVLLSHKLKLIPKIRQELFVLSNLENELCYTVIREMR